MTSLQASLKLCASFLALTGYSIGLFAGIIADVYERLGCAFLAEG
jgi:hypothetical protein